MTSPPNYFPCLAPKLQDPGVGTSASTSGHAACCSSGLLYPWPNPGRMPPSRAPLACWQRGAKCKYQACNYCPCFDISRVIIAAFWAAMDLSDSDINSNCRNWSSYCFLWASALDSWSLVRWVCSWPIITRFNVLPLSLYGTVKMNAKPIRRVHSLIF